MGFAFPPYPGYSLYPHAKAVTTVGPITSRRSMGSEIGGRRSHSQDLRNHSGTQGHTRIPGQGHTRSRDRDLGDRIPCHTLGADQAL